MTLKAMAVATGDPRFGPAVGARFFCTASRGLEPFLLQEVRARLRATQVSRRCRVLGKKWGGPVPALGRGPSRQGRSQTPEGVAKTRAFAVLLACPLITVGKNRQSFFLNICFS